jgi:colanic acid/amylovoran biosynthesis protein
MSSHVTIIGSALSGNKGAAAMLEASIQTIVARVPGTRFTLLSMYPDEDRARNRFPDLDIVPADPRQLGVTINVLALLHRLLPPLRGLIERRSRAIGALAGSAVLLDQGGITFSDGREKFLLYNVASILPALLVGTPVFKCAQAMGPFERPVNRAVARLVLPRVHTIVTRGSRTHAFATGLGLDNCTQGVDYAFALEFDGDEEAEASAVVPPDRLEGAPVVGVSPSVVLERKLEGTGRDYRQIMVGFIDHLTASGYRVLLLPHSVRTGTDKTHNNDLPLCAAIAGAVESPEEVVFVDRELDSQALRFLIGRCDLFVSSRFHAMVSALAMGVPAVVVGWGHKYEEVLELFGLQEWAFGHDQLTEQHLIARFEALAAAGDEVRARLEGALPDVRRRAARQADLIAELLTERA